MTEADAYDCHKKPRLSSGWLAARRRDRASKRWTRREAAMERDRKINLSRTATLTPVAIETPERSSIAGDRERTPPCRERQPQGVFGSPHCFELVPGFDELGSVRHSRNVFQQRPPTSHQQERERAMGRSIRLSTTERRAEEEVERGVQVSPGRTKRNEDRTNWAIAESFAWNAWRDRFCSIERGTRERLPSSGPGANAASHHHHHHRHDRGVAASRNKTTKDAGRKVR
jgi:hypothetical protein